MEKIECGMYVRTNEGIIDEVVIEYEGVCNSPNCNLKHVSCEHDYYDEDKIIKASYNIIDLIEVGDYVNGKRVGFINDSDYYKDIFLSEEYEEPYETMIVKNYKDIKSIVTKEQFSQMEYKIGGNE